jgi:hypothetical protein
MPTCCKVDGFEKGANITSLLVLQSLTHFLQEDDALKHITDLQEQTWELHAGGTKTIKSNTHKGNFPPPFSAENDDDHDDQDLVLCRIISGCLYHYIRCCLHQDSGDGGSISNNSSILNVSTSVSMATLTRAVQNISSASSEIRPWLAKLDEVGDPLLASQYRERLFKVFSKHAASLENPKARTQFRLNHAMQLRGAALEFICHTKRPDTNYVVEQALSCAVQYDRADCPNAQVQDKTAVVRSFYERVYNALDHQREDDKENRSRTKCRQKMHEVPTPLKWPEVCHDY